MDMAMQMQRYNIHGVFVDESVLEEILFRIGDLYDIRIIEATAFAGVMALVGGILGGLAGGRRGATLGAAAAGAAGYGIAREISLRDAWASLKEKLQQLLIIIRDFLRNMDEVDFRAVIDMIVASVNNREQLCRQIIDFLVRKFGPSNVRHQLQH